MKGLFADFQINVLATTISENIPKMTKLCPIFTSHVVDDKMEYTYITSFFWFAIRYTHIILILHQIKVCTAILPPCTPSLPLYAPQYSPSLLLCTAILPPCTPSLPQDTAILPPCTPSFPLCTAILCHVPHHSRYAPQ